MTPRRLQLRRTKGWKKPPGAVVVSRPGVFGNPFRVNEAAGFAARQAVELFRYWVDGSAPMPELSERRARLLARLPELRGKDLLCWCREGAVCHADVLLEIANR